jgi:2-polyprenyl-6-methoxyphenol hydroxylase-like FAD-dependent oxidoreductase
MLGYILARCGVSVIILEKHADFFRDFRGDTIHPSTLQVLDELGLLDAFLKIKHDEIRELAGRIGGTWVKLVDFRAVPGRCKFLALAPQWDFLNFLAEHGRRLSNFRLEMQTEATDLITEGGRVVGVRANAPNGPLEIRAPLVVAADGRSSTLRERAHMQPKDFGVPIDVLWFRISRRPSDPPQSFGNVAPGGILVTIERNDYFQCAFVIRKGGFDQIKARGIDFMRSQIAALAPYLADRVGEVHSFDDVKLLTVTVNRLPVWYRPGLLFIGDAAHAMSPIGGIGINLAIQDAVASANILAAQLRAGNVTSENLRAVQRRRAFPTWVIQGVQLLIQGRAMSAILDATQPFSPPLVARLLDRFAWLRRIPAYLVGIGPRPEHVRCLPPDA